MHACVCRDTCGPAAEGDADSGAHEYGQVKVERPALSARLGRLRDTEKHPAVFGGGGGDGGYGGGGEGGGISVTPSVAVCMRDVGSVRI